MLVIKCRTSNYSKSLYIHVYISIKKIKGHEKKKKLQN
jgi:hypothetical protein